MSLRVRIQDRARPAGHVSMLSASVIIRALQVAIRAEASSIRVRARGRTPKLVRESSGLSLIAIEQGSGVMVWEPDTMSLIDLPSQVFEDFVDESARTAEDANGNTGIQKALLLLETLFRDGSSVQSVEFIDGRNRVGTFDLATVERIRAALSQPLEVAGETTTSMRVAGRLLELDLANRSFQIHTSREKVTVGYEDFFEVIVKEALKQFVMADVHIREGLKPSLLSLDVLDTVPTSRFDDVVATFAHIIAVQDIRPIHDFASLAMETLEDGDSVSLEEFNTFVRTLRSEDDC